MKRFDHDLCYLCGEPIGTVEPTVPGMMAAVKHAVIHRTVPIVALMSLTLAACGEYDRDVTASVTGPATLRVGETAQLVITLTFSDGTSHPVQPSQVSSITTESSNPNILTVSDSGEVRGISPGAATVTVTPSVTSTGTGRRTPGSLTITVIP